MTKEIYNEVVAIHETVASLNFKYYTGLLEFPSEINKKAFERYLKNLNAESRKIKGIVIIGLTKQMENEGALPVDEVPFTTNIYQTQVIPPNDTIKEDYKKYRDW